MNENYKTILQDIQAIIDRDPATNSKLEAILCSSGLHAIIIYRGAHWLWRKNWHLMARIISQIARFFTGILFDNINRFFHETTAVQKLTQFIVSRDYT